VEALEEREIILVGSLNMFERLQERLEDAGGLSLVDATERADYYRSLADPPGLLTRRRPVISLGVGPDAEEDGRVLEAALAGHADFLVTYNVTDFLPACSRHPKTGHPECLGVQVVKPADLAMHLGWPLRVAPAPTLMPPDPSTSGGRKRT